MNPTINIPLLESYIEKFSQEIHKQADALLKEKYGENLQTITKAMESFGITKPPELHVKGIWEDPAALLPPKITAELLIYTEQGVLNHIFHVPIGALHAPDKTEYIIELCMLRAEAYLEIEGKFDGHVLERMTGLAKELHL